MLLSQTFINLVVVVKKRMTEWSKTLLSMGIALIGVVVLNWTTTHLKTSLSVIPMLTGSGPSGLLGNWRRQAIRLSFKRGISMRAAISCSTWIALPNKQNEPLPCFPQII